MERLSPPSQERMTNWSHLMLKRLLVVTFVALSFGWVAPLFLAVRFLLDWCRLEASPTVYNYEREVNSFPFLHESERMWHIAATWASAAAFVWLLVGAWYVLMNRTKAAPDAVADRARD